MKKPLVSVIIPTYNRPEYLAETLESVVNQTYTNIEIIVVDDGSQGNENEIVCANHSHIFYEKIQNSGGPAKPRNIGIELAKGDYIAFVDDDDIWAENKIAEQVNILEKHHDYGLVHCYCEVIDSRGSHLNKIIGRPGNIDVKHGDVKLKMMGNWTIMMPTPLMRRKLIEDLGGFDENIAGTYADVVFFTKCSFHTMFYYIDKPLVFYRIHLANMSSDKKKYNTLPLVLYKLLLKEKANNNVTNSGFFKLRQNLCQMKLKNIKNNPKGVIADLFKLDPLWLFKSNNVKLLVKKIIR